MLALGCVLVAAAAVLAVPLGRLGAGYLVADAASAAAALLVLAVIAFRRRRSVPPRAPHAAFPALPAPPGPAEPRQPHGANDPARGQVPDDILAHAMWIMSAAADDESFRQLSSPDQLVMLGGEPNLARLVKFAPATARHLIESATDGDFVAWTTARGPGRRHPPCPAQGGLAAAQLIRQRPTPNAAGYPPVNMRAPGISHSRTRSGPSPAPAPGRPYKVRSPARPVQPRCARPVATGSKQLGEQFAGRIDDGPRGVRHIKHPGYAGMPVRSPPSGPDPSRLAAGSDPSLRTTAGSQRSGPARRADTGSRRRRSSPRPHARRSRAQRGKPMSGVRVQYEATIMSLAPPRTPPPATGSPRVRGPLRHGIIPC